MDTYNPNKLTAAPKKVDISLRQLADFDQTAGSRDRVDNVRDNQVLVSLSNINRPKTFSFRYLSDLLQGGTGISISTDKDGITTITNTGVTKIIAGSNISISPATGVGNVTINNTITPAPLGYYGAFQDNTIQLAAVIDTPYAVKLNTTDLSNGITIVNNGSGNPTRITIANTGIYNIQFSLQLEKNGGSGNMTADIWLRKNGVDIPSTTGKVVLTGSVRASPIIAAWNYVLDVVGGDYYELMWAVSNIHVEIFAEAATPPHPATPSAILTVTQQSGIMAGTGITAINSLTGAAQTLVTGTSGTDFAISSAGTTHTFNVPIASATNTGKLSSTDWNTFNGKFNLPSLTSGSVLFSNGTTIAQDNANFFWNDANNRLGVGTATPTSRLDVIGTFDALPVRVLRQASYGEILRIGRNGVSETASINYPADGVFAINTAASERIRVNASGNVLIGTTTDAGYRLDVNGTARVSGAATITAQTKIGTTVYTDASSSLLIGKISGSTAARGFLASDTDYQDFAFVATAVSAGNINSWGFGQRRDTYFGNQIGSFQIVGAYYNNSGAGSMVGGGFRVPLICNPDGTVIIAGASSNAINGNVLVGTTTDVASSKLTIASTTQGFLPPRMTTTQKNAIASPAAGLVVYDTTLNKLCVRTASSWETITSI
jgi:hypothetical protein